MDPKLIFKVLKYLARREIISQYTAKQIAATYAERQIDYADNNNQPDNSVVCSKCGQTILPF